MSQFKCFLKKNYLGRDDSLGDFAHDAIHDPYLPDTDDIEQIVGHVSLQPHACQEAIEIAKAVCMEFNCWRKEGGWIDEEELLKPSGGDLSRELRCHVRKINRRCDLDSITAAATMLDLTGTVATMKLHKLLWFANRKSLAETGSPLVEEEFREHVGGPALESVFELHRGCWLISPGDLGDASTEPDPSIFWAYSTYGHLPGRELSELVRAERDSGARQAPGTDDPSLG